MIIAMHISDGLVNIPISAVFAALAIVGVLLAVRGAQRQLDERTAPIAGLVAVFVFAAQMLNFPVAAGTSGHLLGGVLAAVLVGPWAATLAITLVLLVQGLMFADGGLTALGLNVTNMALIGVWVGWGLFVVARKAMGRTRTGFLAATAIAAFLSVPAAAAGFVLEYALGGAGTFSINTVLMAMVGTHVLIGLGEAAITVLTVSAVLASRSDLVFGLQRKLEIRNT